MAKHAVVVESMNVTQGQGVLEGNLELRGRFTANNVELLYPSGATYLTASPGSIVYLNKPITTVENMAAIPVKAELWEVEPGGGQGGTDYGSMTGTLNIGAGRVDLTVPISADTWREKKGTVVVSFKTEPVSSEVPVEGTYLITLELIDVVRDQRTGTFNFEGALELRTKISVDNGPFITYPPAGILTLRQGEQINPALFIASVTNKLEVPVRVEIEELEFGGQGGTDIGVATGTLNVTQGSAVLTVTTSADNAKEKSAIVRIVLRAAKQS